MINAPCHPSETASIVAAVIPCYRCRRHILDVIARIGHEVKHIFVVDDACPEGTGRMVEEQCRDPRVQVIFHERNQGVGGAVLTGYQAARAVGAHVAIKIDGDGQMDPALVPRFIRPILASQADYTKGNRFYDLEGVAKMPAIRLIGNAALSFMSKLSSGYWDVFDPTNGYTAIHGSILSQLPTEKIAKRYFFESDMLFRLNLARAVVLDIPMRSVYADETSNLKISKITHEFLCRHGVNFSKRIFYNYFLRNFSVASLELVIGTVLLIFGIAFGSYHWWLSYSLDTDASTGTVMLAALPVMIGVQFLLNFLNYDISSVPRIPLSPRLAQEPRQGPPQEEPLNLAQERPKDHSQKGDSHVHDC